ncbi:hypothetical protein [Burkholderia gladioli]|uniref:hypothetical protein n=2 Tax=Burkholderia gladioli TaxID=28095 RepID=UPI00264DF7BE|nr:hypothetical protein [Burkholderia gladioli]MDN7752333.1 hypothetical protein [Burkholderia gladioli]
MMMRKPYSILAASALLAFASSAFAAGDDAQAPSQSASATAQQARAQDSANVNAGYGAQPRYTAEAGKRAQDPFTINGRSMYDVH